MELGFREVGTPKTHRRFLGREDGTYGPIPSSRPSGMMTMPFNRTAIKCLYCVGDSTFPGQVRIFIFASIKVFSRELMLLCFQDLVVLIECCVIWASNQQSLFWMIGLQPFFKALEKTHKINYNQCTNDDSGQGLELRFCVFVVIHDFFAKCLRCFL